MGGGSGSVQRHDFWGFFQAAQQKGIIIIQCAVPGCGSRARKLHGGASTLQHVAHALVPPVPLKAAEEPV